jgi:hypothetical protein
MARDDIMRMVKLFREYYNSKKMEWYELPHSNVLEGSGRINLGNDCLSKGSCQ